MSLAGRFILLKQQKKTKPCERCGLHYPYEESDSCVHCFDLDEAGLKRLLEKIERQGRWYQGLGLKFFILATLSFIALVVISG